MSFIASSRLPFLPTLLIAGNLLCQASAQEPTAPAPEQRYPQESAVTFQWDYSCQNGKLCSFNCLGNGGASHVTKLTVRLGTLPVGTQHVPALLYSFSTNEIETGKGFVVSAGLSTLSCQVNGMTEVYAGPAKFL